MQSKKAKHANIPIFIPHLGCPNLCVFCDQRAISGVCEFTEGAARREIDSALATIRPTGRRAEIAFFGGSFTGIDRGLMTRLLDTAQEYVDSGDAFGIRMSTRPDYIDEEIINILRHYTVTQVELGIQSMSEDVLRRSRRGHTPDDTRRACTLLREAGLPFGGQMMVGLPGADGESEVECARRICEMGADSCRIYPTIVFRKTELEQMTVSGEYTPLSLDEAVERSADVLEVFASYGVQCLRIGLCESENLHSDEKYLAGPTHPAMGELVRGEVYLRRIREALTTLQRTEPHGKTSVEVPWGALSAAVGNKRRNALLLESEFKEDTLSFSENGELPVYTVRVYRKT